MIDWTKQWEEFAENFHDGYAHISLMKYGADKDLKLRLAPGPGFGDLSHPTTALMLKLLIEKASGQIVLDIGCGSGILALSAALLGSEATGFDICKDAVLHAQKNACLNQLKKAQFFTSCPVLKKKAITLMNMLQSEQKQVMQEKEKLNGYSSLWITSGILEEQKDSYLALTASWGWKLNEMRSKSGWLAFVFSCN